MSTQHATTAPRRIVLADLLPGELVRDILLVLAGAGFVGLMAQISVTLPWTVVPLTGQTLAVLCAGAALGPLRGMSSMVLYALAGIAGAPWFAGGSSGWGGPAFGYILGFIVAAAVVGALAARGADRTPLKAVPAMLLGTLIIYAIGVPWLANNLGVDLGKAIDLGVRPFVGGDLIKLALAAGLLPAAWRIAGPRR
ncbi:MAG: biotin transport system substrate-specific component [Solirubrobacteraceae bacterium]|jgi:biotin transport system substrate-specific component|nr:biotin transport system substrate-specific component [Solirubrobacteraceae bacterium]